MKFGEGGKKAERAEMGAIVFDECVLCRSSRKDTDW